MSYLRNSHPLIYVEGVSRDYVFPTEYKGKEMIEDYGSITNEGIIEILMRQGDFNDDLLLKHLAKRLAENLDIKLRDKPLSDEEYDKLDKEIMEQVEKENEEFMKKLKENKKQNG